jgi:tetratricopeptide (TPR) repeat protein
MVQALYVWAYYAWKPFLPFQLCPFYDTLITVKPTAWPFVSSFAFVVGLSVFLFFKRSRWPLIWTAWLCHLVLLIPVLGLTEHPHFPSDRYSIVANIAWSILVAAGIFELWLRRRNTGNIILACAAATVVLGVMSFRQTAIWQNSITLFEYAVQRTEETPFVHIFYQRLGVAYQERNQYTQALAVFERAMQLKPDDLLSRFNAANILLNLGRIDEAASYLNYAYRLNPNDADVNNSLGVIQVARKDLEGALKFFIRATKLNPRLAGAYEHIGLTLAKQGKDEEARKYFQISQELKSKAD